MSTVKWKIEHGLCRCCHSEGNFKNLAEPCKVSGLNEIYSDMLKDCFNIDLTPVPGVLCAITYTICENCISRLRDASAFKKQVQACEDRFRDMYNKNVIGIDSDEKVSIKEEISEGLDDDFNEDLLPDDEDYEEPIDYKCEDEDFNGEEDIRRKKKPKKSDLKRPCRTVKQKKVKHESAAEDTGNKKDSAKETAPYYIKEKQENGSTNFVCTTCWRSYKALQLVNQHYRHVHLRLRPKLRGCYMCDVKVPAHLRAFHLENDHGIPAPTCNACGKKFAYQNEVLRHQKHYHMGEKKFACQHCDLKFYTQGFLNRHMTKHSAVRNYKCELCEKAFKWKKNLQTHIMMHLDVRNHVCSVCHAAFVQQSSLKHHMIKQHPEFI